MGRLVLVLAFICSAAQGLSIYHRASHRALPLALRHRPLVCSDVDENAAPSESKEGLISYSALSPEFKIMIDQQLVVRNKERILQGKPKYADINDFAQTYFEYEGKDRDLSRAECEDEVLRFLQRRALMDEGSLDLKDPQTIFTFGLLIALVGGVGFKLATQGLPPTV